MSVKSCEYDAGAVWLWWRKRFIGELFLNSPWWLLMSVRFTFNLDQSEPRHFLRPLIGQWKQLATVEGLSAI